MRRIIAGLLLSSLLVAQQDIRTETLANGMKVIVQEDHGIPNVAMYFFFRIGSRNEKAGTTGVSHFFEHMMFNGAKKYGPKEFDRNMEMNGGNNNAYTTEDVTVYTDWFPSSALPLMFDLEADRIRDLAFDPKMIESERGVVYSERRSSVDNSNSGALSELAQAAAFVAHPYHWPVVGWPSDIEGWTMDDLKAHWSMGYAPNNCTMVIVGDVRWDNVLDLSRKFLEPIPRRDPPPPVRTREPEQMGGAPCHSEQARATAHPDGAIPHTREQAPGPCGPSGGAGTALNRTEFPPLQTARGFATGATSERQREPGAGPYDL